MGTKRRKCRTVPSCLNSIDTIYMRSFRICNNNNVRCEGTSSSCCKVPRCIRVAARKDSSTTCDTKQVGRTSNKREFREMYGIYKWGAAASWLLLVMVLLLTPQLYVFYAYGRRRQPTGTSEGVDVNRRLSSESSILLAATPDQVQLLRSSLMLPLANVTAQEVDIRPVSSIDEEMEKVLNEKNIVGIKDLRISVLFVNDKPLSVDNEDPISAKGAICKEGQRAMLVSIGRVSRHADKRVYAELMLHSPSMHRYSEPVPGVFNLAALNPATWGNGRLPTDDEKEYFQGTAICLYKGSPMQLIKGWPMRVPDYKEGPWEATVKVERAIVTPSAEVKKNLLLLQATLQIYRVPKEGIFKEQNLSSIPFMGYVEKGATKRQHLAGAVIRHQLLNKTCKLRRETAKSQVELLCEDVEATLANLNDMVEERPKLREVFKKTGIVGGISVASFGLALGSHLLGTLRKELALFDIPTCLWGGAAAGAASLLYTAIAGPITALKRFKWRKKFGLMKRKFLKKIVKEEEDLPSSTDTTVDLILVVNELEHESEEVPDPSQLGINVDVQPDPTLIDDPAKTSPIAAKVQQFISRYIYLETILPAIQRFEARGFSRFKQRAEEDKRELAQLRNFLRKAGRLNAQLLSIDDEGDFHFTAQQKLRAYTYLGEQLQQELARDLRDANEPLVAVEVLYSKEKCDCMLKQIKQLYDDLREAGAYPLPVDTTKSLLKCLKERLQQVKKSEELIDAEVLGSEEKTGETLAPEKEGERKIARNELLLAKAAVKEAVDALLLELRIHFENELQLALEEVDNLKEALNSVKQAAGKEPSPQQKAEMRDTVSKIKKLNQTIVSIIYDMRKLGIEVDILHDVPIEEDTP